MSETNPSPFHRGEQAIQTRLGVRERMERFGRQVIRGYLPDQHRNFYRALPYVFVGHADAAGWPWASVLAGEPGFMSTPDRQTLRIDVSPLPEDPLAQAIESGQPLGLLGIELHTRRRNRLSGRICRVTSSGLELRVDQTFGNCPQYIQGRDWAFRDRSRMPPSTRISFNRLDEAALNLIRESDTFFVASYVPHREGGPEQNVDVSHRGGRPGFVRTDHPTRLTIPDYLGNFHFNTLGNFVENPKAGLLFIDFDAGHLLMLTGRAEVLWNSPETTYFDGAERLWTFELDHGIWLKNALPIHWQPPDYSPNTLLTGTWDSADKKRQALERQQRWVPHQVVRVVEESDEIYSFYLQPEDGVISDFKPGQFLTLRAKAADHLQVRTYTVSSARHDMYYRISVKRDGVFSRYLHEQVSPGDWIEVKAPAGQFTLDTKDTRPAVLIAAGVGITPMVSMLRHAANEAIRTRHLRPITLIATARSNRERAFYHELTEIAEAWSEQIRIYWCLTQPGSESRLGRDYHFRGRLSARQLADWLPRDEAEFFLCGPGNFMQSTYDSLRRLGLPDEHIFAESFGPSALRRDAAKTVEMTVAAEEAIVSVVDASGRLVLEHPWLAADGSLLNFLENHGLAPPYGCRIGQCGSCRVNVVEGRAAHPQGAAISPTARGALLCCAKPAAHTEAAIPRLRLALPA